MKHRIVIGCTAAALAAAGVTACGNGGTAPHVTRKIECTRQHQQGCPPGSYTYPVWLLVLNNGRVARVSRSTYDQVVPGSSGSGYDPETRTVVPPEEENPPPEVHNPAPPGEPHNAPAPPEEPAHFSGGGEG